MNELIRSGLWATQKTLPSAYLYDGLGSLLFEAITLLPEYEVARADTRMLGAHLLDALSILPGPLQVIELGPGHGRKARVVLSEVIKRQALTSFVAVDVAAAALDGCRQHLEDLAGVTVSTIEGTFIEGLRRAPSPPKGHRRLVLFLGSNLANFDRIAAQAFLKDIRSTLAPGDGLLLSADLEKPAEQLLPAYDDALGVTAAFNKNVLLRLNRELGANFDVRVFEHEARWSASARRIEMHLRATRACDVQVKALHLNLHFDAGETIWTESSHRFSLSELRGWASEAGFSCAQAWVDEAWPFVLTLFIATADPSPQTDQKEHR